METQQRRDDVIREKGANPVEMKLAAPDQHTHAHHTQRTHPTRIQKTPALRVKLPYALEQSALQLALLHAGWRLGRRDPIGLDSASNKTQSADAGHQAEKLSRYTREAAACVRVKHTQERGRN